MADEQRAAPRCSVNGKLLPVKMLFFALYGGSGCLMPYISVYMKQLGLSSMETGLIYGIMPFVTFFICPLFGMIADKTKGHKLVLIICFLLSGLCYCLLLLVPGSVVKIETIRVQVKGKLNCGPVETFMEDCGGNINHCGVDMMKLVEQLENTQSKGHCEFVCKARHATVNESSVCFGNETLSDKCITLWNGDASLLSAKDSNTGVQYSVSMNDTSSTSVKHSLVDDQHVNLNDLVTGDQRPTAIETTTHQQLKFGINDLANKVTRIGNNKSKSIKDCHQYNVDWSINVGLQNFTHFFCPVETVFECEITCGAVSQEICKSAITEGFSSSFWLFLALFLICNVFTTPIPSMVVNLSYSVLGEEKRASWGKQRLWGTIGFIVLAPTSALIMDLVSKSSTNVDYSWAFYIYLGFHIGAAVITYTIKNSEEIVSGSFLKNVWTLFRYPEIVVFLILMIFFGMFSSVIEVFLFWRLKDLNSPQIVLGLSLVFSCIPEAIMLRYAGKIVNKIGYNSCLNIALLAFALRFFAYSLITNPWHVLFIEPLHAFTFALMYTAATAYACAKAPSGMSGTVHGIRAGFHSGLGKGIGGLMTGKMFDPVTGLGEVWTFRVYAMICIATFIIYAAIQCVFFKTDAATNNDKTNTVDKQLDDEETGTVLLNGTALQEAAMNEDAQEDTAMNEDAQEASVTIETSA